MAAVLNFRPFKFPNITESQFFTSNSAQNKEFAIADLGRSGLLMEDVGAYQHPMLRLKDGATAGYVIPYFGLDGQPLTDKDQNLIMYRTRLKMPEFAKGPRYDQPSGDQLAAHGLPPSVPYINPLTFELEADYVVCAEGEKKAASIMRYLGIPAFGIGGCHMWRNPLGDGSLHPWIRKILDKRGTNKLIIVPDGDLRRYDIYKAYGDFVHAAKAQDIDVQLLEPSGKIDDLLVQWGAEANANWDGIKRVSLDNLVQSPSTLIKQYGLAHKFDSKGLPIVHQHTSNITILMESHPAFPKVWRNLDNNRIYVGDDEAEPAKTEMDIANHMQHYFGLEKVTHRVVRECILALSKTNERSPFLDYVRGLKWDRVPRLDTWLQDLWGVSDTPFTREVAAKFMVSACARMDNPGVKIDWMMIVVGPQATGKTSMPGILFKGSNLTLYGENSDKDLHMLLHSSLCVGFDELDSFSKRESSNLKAMVTRNEDQFRPPYGASVEIFPRRFTLYGCGNRYEFLQHDPSGYRRYAIIEVGQLLNFAGLEAARDQLWAEAWDRYNRGGVKYWEVEGASENAKRFAIPNQYEEAIEDYLVTRMNGGKIAKGDDKKKLYFKMSDLTEHLGLGKIGANSMVAKDISAALHSLGCAKPNDSTKHPETGVSGKWWSYEEQG